MKWVLFFFIAITSSLSAQAFDRIVTLSPMVAEWTVELLGPEQSLKKIVGTSEYSNYPELLQKVETLGPYHQLKIEKIANLHPDLVLASDEYNIASQIEQLKRLHLNVKILPKESFTHMASWIVALGEILGSEREAKQKAQFWDTQLSELKNKKQNFESCLIEVQENPLIVVGGNGFLNEAFALLGCKNIFSNLNQGYPKVSKEAVIARNPSRIFILSLTQNSDEFEKAKGAWKKFDSIQAVKNQKITILPGDDFARCSLRLLKALKQLN